MDIMEPQNKLSTSLPQRLPPRKAKVVDSGKEMNLRTSHFAVLPDLSDSWQNTFTTTAPVAIYPQLDDEPHPYPYYVSAEVYLDDSDEDGGHIVLNEETVELFLLNSNFAKEFMEEFLDDLLLDDVKKTARSFTRRRAAADLAVDPKGVKQPLNSIDKSSTEEDGVLLKYVEDEIVAAADVLSRHVQLEELENYSKSLTKSDIERLSKEAKMLWIDPKSEEAVATRVYQTINEPTINNRTSISENNIAKFKHMKINIYVLIYNRLWTDVVSQENQGLRRVKQLILCNTAWKYLFTRLLASVEDQHRKS